jgi:hypothetical protein
MDRFKEDLRSKVSSELFDILDIALQGVSSEEELCSMLENIESEKESIRMYTLSSGDIIDLKYVKRAEFKPIFSKSLLDYIGGIQLNKGCSDKDDFCGAIIELEGDIIESEEEVDNFKEALKKYKNR